MVLVSVEQESTQEVEQEVTMESIMQLVDVDPQVQGSRDKVKELVQEFEDELDQEEPDEGVLRQFVEKARLFPNSVKQPSDQR